MIKFDENKNITEEYKNYVSNLKREELEIMYIGADAYVDRLNDDIKVLLKENEAKEKVIIKQDNVLNALEESYIEDIEKLESFGIERQVEIAEIISCYKFYLRRLRELKESDK